MECLECCDSLDFYNTQFCVCENKSSIAATILMKHANIFCKILTCCFNFDFLLFNLTQMEVDTFSFYVKE